jgi:hypothetical protein
MPSVEARMRLETHADAIRFALAGSGVFVASFAALVGVPEWIFFTEEGSPLGIDRNDWMSGARLMFLGWLVMGCATTAYWRKRLGPSPRYAHGAMAMALVLAAAGGAAFLIGQALDLGGSNPFVASLTLFGFAWPLAPVLSSQVGWRVRRPLSWYVGLAVTLWLPMMCLGWLLFAWWELASETNLGGPARAWFAAEFASIAVVVLALVVAALGRRPRKGGAAK